MMHFGSKLLAGILAGTTLSLGLMMSARRAPEGGAQPVAQIIAPVPAAKLRKGQTVPVRVRVQPGAHPVRRWQLSLLGPSSERELAAGTVALADQAVAQLVADQLVPGEPHALSLQVEDIAGTTVDARVSLFVADPLYTLIPLEPGNLSRPVFEGLSVDGSGRFVSFGGGVLEGTLDGVFVRDSLAGTVRRIVVRRSGTGGQKLSRDGRRFFFAGSDGVSFYDLQSDEIVEGPQTNSFFYNVDHSGGVWVFQSNFNLDPDVGNYDRKTQYFAYDHETKTVRQLTTDPQAIVLNAPSGAYCPQRYGTIPLITADGATVVFTTHVTLGLAAEDPAVGCHVFAYDVPNGALRHVVGLPADLTVQESVLSDDGRWLAIGANRTLPSGAVFSVVRLLDLETGELSAPWGDPTTFPFFDSIITGDGSTILMSSAADLDPRVGNADHNLELYAYDRASGTMTQVTETTAGVLGTTRFCRGYEPVPSSDGRVMVFSFSLISAAGCYIPEPQRNEADGFVLGRVRAVRRRPGNHAPALEQVGSAPVQAGNVLTLDLRASDWDDDPIAFFAQTPGGKDVPPGSEITDHHDGTATFRWPTRIEHTGIHHLRVAAFDEGGGETVQNVSIVVCNRLSRDGNLAGVLSAVFEPDWQALCRDTDLNRDGVVTAADLISAAKAR